MAEDRKDVGYCMDGALRMKSDCAHCESRDCYDLAEGLRKSYSPSEIASMRVSGEIEAEHYMKMTRIEELTLFAEKMGMRKLGMAFCVGLSGEPGRYLTYSRRRGSKFTRCAASSWQW
ncbi:MAG: DUF1847 domain-containing protein [Methanobacteriota archaeon]|nr:MAG: DUF1847 domain-containing protein [Euryarchaeota archaeon]